ncbi:MULTISPECIES: cytochrome P450 [Streptomyces]|uniref:Cytochrome P450 n=1 Tax=Streptomyces stelliscabiei TaxID=146820 RepID=A0A8I0NX43_9ACTN|nr:MULTISPECIES: cytochrome P450 [Streptomyces]MBE1594100.1 cytochrome P450 [Streptomyces stelliscabiei]MDX2520335.1 cytochrome P450 [Streptomyces stelliscabiei]MDX3274889.1 cytochrome P450 [Streptomyces scabiei]PIM66642.1 cytochrome P450 [Streptomyces sp. JV178]
MTLTDVPWITAGTTDLRELEKARVKSWIARSDRGYEVLRYGPGLGVLEHPSLLKGPSFLKRLDDLGIVDGELRRFWNQVVTTTEGDQRKRMRVPLAKLLRPMQISKLKDTVRQTVHDILDEVDDPTDVALLDGLAWKIPSRLYCHLVSAPVELAPTVARLSDSVLGPLLNNELDRRQEFIDATWEAIALARDHIGARRRDLGDDFTSAMIRQEEAGDLTEEEVHAEAVAILTASIDNTVHQIGITFGKLLEEPSRWQDVVADPAKIPAATEEAIRLRPRFNTIFRLAAEDVEIDGFPIEAGAWVYVSVRASQRDPEVFNDPGTWRLDRPTVRQMMFGAGPYNCLGQHLARLEINEAVLAVAQRFPGLRLTEDFTTRENNAVTEVTRLQVSLV